MSLQRRFSSFLLLVVLTFSFPAAVRAGGRDLVVLQFRGTSADHQFQEQATQLIGRFAARLGWPADSAKAYYFDQTADALAFIENNKPGFIWATTGFYLKYQEQLRLEPINQVVLTEGTEVYYFVVVHKGTVKYLEDLRGRTLAGAHLVEPEFIEKIVLNDRLKLGTDLKIQHKAVSTALLELSRGQIDAVIIDTVEQRSLKSLSFYDQLEVIYRSSPIPNTGIMAVNGNADAADVAALGKACENFCGTLEGESLCRAFGITAFAPVKEGIYRGIIEQWRK